MLLLPAAVLAQLSARILQSFQRQLLLLLSLVVASFGVKRMHSFNTLRVIDRRNSIFRKKYFYKIFRKLKD